MYLASSEELQAVSLQNSADSLRNRSHADDWYGAMSNLIDFQMGSVERKLASAVTTRSARCARTR